MTPTRLADTAPHYQRHRWGLVALVVGIVVACVGAAVAVVWAVERWWP